MLKSSRSSDGLSNQGRSDQGYRGPCFNEIIGIRNINNDTNELDDPRTTLTRADKTTVTDKKQTTMDVSSIFSLGPKDVVVLKENSNGIVEFQTYFQDACSLHQQINPNSPTNIIDAALSDEEGLPAVAPFQVQAQPERAIGVFDDDFGRSRLVQGRLRSSRPSFKVRLDSYPVKSISLMP